MSDFKVILEAIKSFDNICIFRHQRPDGDATGAQLGLKEWIKDNYPDKNVFAVGTEVYDIYPYKDDVADEVIENSLAIILDTANRERIDDVRWSKASKSIKIDHHPLVDNFADINYVNDGAASLCEYLTTILVSFDKKISKLAATYLYSGILTDTLNFSTSQVNSVTLQAAAVLADSDIDIYEINQKLFSIDKKMFNFRTHLRQKINEKGALAYVIFNEEDYKMFNITDSKARFQISELSNVKDFKIWAIFTKNEEGSYDGSLRSKKDYQVNDIAANYGGGGHKNASGIKKLKAEDLEHLIDELYLRANS